MNYADEVSRKNMLRQSRGVTSIYEIGLSRAFLPGRITTLYNPLRTGISVSEYQLPKGFIAAPNGNRWDKGSANHLHFRL